MTGIFGSKRQQAEDAAELARLLAQPVEPLTPAEQRKLARIAKTRLNRIKFYAARGQAVPPDRPDDEDAEA